MLTIVRDSTVLDAEVNAGLEYCVLTGVTIDADPGSGVRRALARGSAGRRDSERANNASPGRLSHTQRCVSKGKGQTIPTHRSLTLDRAGPVRRVLDVRVVRRERRDGIGGDLGLRRAARRAALETTGEAIARRELGSRKGGASEEEGGESELHHD